MRNPRQKLQQLIALLALCVVSTTGATSAQTYATGAILTTPEDLARLPKAPRARGFIPLSVDLGQRFPPVRNQGRMGSCTAFAVGHAALGYLMNQGQPSRLDRSELPAPRYIYALSKATESCADGARIPDVLRLLMRGTAREKESPYSDQNCARPDTRLVARVEQHADPVLMRFGVIFMTTSEETYLDAIKQELARGYPLVIGLKLNPAFDRLQRGIWDGTADTDEKSGHALTLTGYDEKDRTFSFINSWSTDWGNKGYGRMSYETLTAQKVAAFTMRVRGITPQPADPAFPGEIIGLTLPKLDCARLQLEDGAISGYVASEIDIGRVRQAIGDRNLRMKVDIRPWPQCELLDTLKAELAGADTPGLDLPGTSLARGDALTIRATTAGFEGFLQLSYFQADGSVVHLLQPDPLRLRVLSLGESFVFGDGQEGRPRFTVTAPFGPEMVLAIQSGSPLFPAPRPRTESARDYLTALRAAILARPFADRRPRVITATVFALDTREEK